MPWRYLDDACETAVVGRDGWLFYQAGVRYLIERPSYSPEDDPLPAIRSFRDQLRAIGIRLLVVPVPGKESVYPDKPSPRAEGVVVGERTRPLFDWLGRDGIESVDLFEVFRGARRDEGRSDRERLYLAHDTHWSPEGARLAAEAVARRVLAGGAVRRGDQDYEGRPAVVRRYGDLVEMLRVPRIEKSPGPESLECQQVFDRSDGGPYRAWSSAIAPCGSIRTTSRDRPGSSRTSRGSFDDP